MILVFYYKAFPLVNILSSKGYIYYFVVLSKSLIVGLNATFRQMPTLPSGMQNIKPLFQ